MSVHVPQPGRRRVVSLLWFPFFFVAAMSWLFSIAFAAPHPHHVAIGVVAQEEVNAGLDAALSNAKGSFDVVEMGSVDTARAQVASADLSAAVVCRTTDTACDVVIASAAGRGQATTVSSDVQVAMEQLGHT